MRDGKNMEFEEHVAALETGGEEAASYMEFMTRNDRNSTRFAKNQNCVRVLVKSTEAACKGDLIDESSFLGLMKNIANIEAGAKGLTNEGAVPILFSVAKDKRHTFLNRAYALEVLDILGEELEDFFNEHEEFVTKCRKNWDHWVDILECLPARYSSLFILSSSDSEALFKCLSSNNPKDFRGMSAVQVIVNVLSHLYARPLSPDSKPSVIKQITLFTQHDGVPAAIPYLVTHQLADKASVNLKLTCYSLLSISNNFVRQHVVDEGNIPLLLSLLHNNNIVPLHLENVIKSLVLVAFCSCGDFVKHGGVDAFVKLLKQQKYISSVLVGLWVVATDIEYYPFMSGVPEVLKPIVSHPDHSKLAVVNDYGAHILALLKGAKEVKTKPKNKKKGKQSASEKLSIDQNRPKYQSVESKLFSFCSHMGITIATIPPIPETNNATVVHLCNELKLMSQFIHCHSVERYPESKQVIDFFWMCFNYHVLEISNSALSSFLFLLSHWVMLDPKAPNKYTKALLFGIPRFESDFNDDRFNKGVAEILIWINKIDPKPGGPNDGDNDKDRQINLLSSKLDQQQEEFSATSTRNIEHISELTGAMQIYAEDNLRLKEQLETLSDTNLKCDTKIKELWELHKAKEVVIGQLKEECERLKVAKEAQPSDERLMAFLQHSNIDPFDLLNVEGLGSLDEISAIKSKLGEKLKRLKQRKREIQRGKELEHEQALRSKEQQLDKYKEVVMCPICMNKDKNTIFVPCGHAYCDKCSGAILNSNSGRCPICRINVDSHHQFYM